MGLVQSMGARLRIRSAPLTLPASVTIMLSRKMNRTMLEATLIVSGLKAVPAGKTYEAWVMHDGTAVAAGIFRASPGTTVVHLTKRLPHGGTVGVSCVGGTTRVWIYLPDRPSIGSTS